MGGSPATFFGIPGFGFHWEMIYLVLVLYLAMILSFDSYHFNEISAQN
jgi:hypothetical protein